MNTKTPASQIKYRDNQKTRGLTQVRTWVPTEYAEWYRLVGQRLREAKKLGGKIDMPPVFKD